MAAFKAVVSFVASLDSGQAIQQTAELLMIWDAMTLMWYHYGD